MEKVLEGPGAKADRLSLFQTRGAARVANNPVSARSAATAVGAGSGYHGGCCPLARSRTASRYPARLSRAAASAKSTAQTVPGTRQILELDSNLGEVRRNLEILLRQVGKAPSER